MKFEIYKDKKQEHRFRIRADNGKILCHSEGYSSKRNAKYGANLIRLNAQDILISYDRLK